jgi:outer membrane protein TolC
MRHVWRLFAALPLLACVIRGASSNAGDLPLPEKIYPALDTILRSAIQQSPRMISGALDLEQAENDRIQARSGLLPFAGAFFRDYQTRDDRADLPGQTLSVNKIYYDISVSQPVFFWNEKRNNARMGEIRQKISQGRYREGYRLFAQEVRSQYLLLVLGKLALTRARFYQQYAKDQLKTGEERYQQKLISDNQIFTTRLDAERADMNVERLEFDYANAKQTFARLTGTPELEEDAIPEVIPTVTYPTAQCDQLLADYLAQKDYPTIEADILRKQIEIDDLNYRVQKVRLLPKFSVAVGTNQDEQSYTLNTAQKYRVTSYYAGVQVNWPIFDGFATRAAVHSALAHRRQLEGAYQDLSARLAAQARQQNKLIYFSARNMAIDDRYLDSGEGDFRNKQDDFKRGVISEADLNLVRLGLYDRQINAYRSRIDVLQKVGDFLGTIEQDPVSVYLALPAEDK